MDISTDFSKLYVALNGTGSFGIIDLSTDSVVEIFVSELDDLRTWDVEETEANRIFVSANPGSSSSAYVVEVITDSIGNLISEQRIADNLVIRSWPTFTVSPE